MQYKILVIEDDADINGLLVKILKEASYDTIQAFSGTEAKLLLEKDIPDLILLDLMLPGLSGEELLRNIRENQHCSVPVLVISAINSLGDKVKLLKNGADDYITKPFEPEEVIARVQVSLRNVGKESDLKQILSYKKMQFYPLSRKVMLDGEELMLTAHEYDILFLLMQNPQKVYSRDSLYELVWQGGYYGENNTVNVHISNLRKKIKAIDSTEEYIQTVYGIGFKLL
ncbi:MAG: response regulator transcription factor [Lachnospiraceae bacterium]